MSARHGSRFGPPWMPLVVLVTAIAGGWGVGRLFAPTHLGDPAPLVAMRPLMGTVVEIQCRRDTGTDAETARIDAAIAAAFGEMARVDSLFSTHLPRPTLRAPSARRRETLALLDEGLAVMRLTDGALDPRLRPLLTLWGFESDAPSRPAEQDVAAETARLRAAGWPHDAETLLADPQILHFGAWAKGYAVDRAIAVLRDHGVDEALVNAGGEIRTLGDGWTVGVQHPRLRGAVLARVTPGAMAVATSGDYEQEFTQEGVRYHHLLDPHTGAPARGCQSVTVLAPTCMRADALATGIFVLGPERGLALIDSLDETACLIIDAAGRRHESARLRAYLVD